MHADALRAILRADPNFWDVLCRARALDLPDWWIVSGAIYNAVWNHQDGRDPGNGIKDFDLFYFDPDTSWEAEDAIIRSAPSTTPPLEIRNQARVHLWYQRHFGHPIAQLKSCEDSIARFAAMTHAVGVRLNGGEIQICAPFGLEFIFQRRMVPNPINLNRRTYETKADRVRAYWPTVSILPWPETSIIRADVCDWSALLALLHRAFSGMEGRIDPPSSLHRLTTDDLAQKARTEACFLAHDGFRLTGCVFAAPHRDALYVGKLAVEPEMHGRGVGRALMAACEAEARSQGLARLELQTRIELVENHATFERMGFIKTRETAHPGYGRATSITLEKAL